MNIFAVDLDPVVAAQSLCDRHVVKMALETAQLLCSAFEPGDAPYRRTHFNHPCARWARYSPPNFDWTVRHGLALCEEYSFRYEKTHACKEVIEWCRDNQALLGLPDVGLTPMYQAMPDEYKADDVVEAYRAYYRGEKASFATWKKRTPPDWWSLP